MNLIRNLIGLIITITMLPICIESFKYVSNIPFNYNEISDEIALAQLREQLLIAYDMNQSSNELNFVYKNKNYKLSLVNNKLILQPGTQIYLNDIDDLHFENRGNIIYVTYTRKYKEFERAICKKEGLYINDFSDCHVLLDEHSGFEEWLYYFCEQSIR